MLRLLVSALMACGALAAQPSCTTQLKSPTPTGFRCGARGSLLRPTVLATPQVTTQQACRNACLDMVACRAFSFDGTTCTLYPQRPSKEGFRGDSSSKTKFWNRHCFSITCSCPNGPGSSPLLCSGQCVDPTSDPQNCGSCGGACLAPTTACSASTCVCPINGQQACGGSCTDTSSDPNNCGSCINVCLAPTTACSASACVCPINGQQVCGNSCTDTSSDPNNCGSCSTVCQLDSTCQSGSCLCPDGADPTNLQSNNQDCGTCGNVCQSSSTCQSGTCACPDGSSLSSLQSNNNDCGSCGNICQSGSTCQSGTCACPDGSSLSSLQSNNNDCGTCGNVCRSGSTCQSGACACADGSPASSLQSNNRDCSTCGNVCQSSSTCQSGTCACPDGSPLSSLPTNLNDCGTCGVKCVGSGATCSSGSCGCSDPSKTYCSTSGCIPTVSLQYDSSNCGTCGHTCAAGQICSQGGCIPDPGSCGNRGVQWAYFNNIDGPNQDDTYSQFQPSHYSSGQAVLHTGQVQQIGTWTQDSDQIYNSGIQAGTQYYVINHRGYILAPASGSYTVTIDMFIDDIACFWIGTSAYSGYTRANAALCRASGIDFFSGPHQITINLVGGTYYPFRVMYAQAQQDTYFGFSITFASTGLTIISGTPNSAVPWVITQGCSGSPAAFPPFGQES